MKAEGFNFYCLQPTTGGTPCFNSIENEKFSRGTVKQISLQNFFEMILMIGQVQLCILQKEIKGRGWDGNDINRILKSLDSLPMKFLKSEPDHIPILSCSVKNA